MARPSGTNRTDGSIQEAIAWLGSHTLSFGLACVVFLRQEVRA